MSGRQLILTVTRQCNLRCSYCPTAKDGWPSLTEADATGALAMFCERFGGGDVKLFGGEPLLVPDVVGAVIDAVANEPRIRRVYLSTNGIALDESWLRRVRDTPKLILTISLDGRPEDHRRHRRTLPMHEVVDAYDHVLSLLPALATTPRVVITQTIPPATAEQAADNFDHLVGLGFRRFNLLPGYYLAWKEQQLGHLRASLLAIRRRFEEAWRRDERLYLRNLFTYAPTPFFNDGLVVDADRTIHPSNVGLSGALEGLLVETRCGTLDDPPTPEALARSSRAVNGLLERSLSLEVWRSTLAVDAELTRMVRALYPAFVAHKKRRRAA